MEKAIIKTLSYADIFDYPLKAWEIHKWLIGPPAGRAGKKATLRQVESALGGLVKSEKCKVQSGYYFLPKRAKLVAKRRRREKQSSWYLKKAKVLTTVLKLIPWIKLVGISGGLAMNNASKADDIDLFLITTRKRLWIARFLAIILLSLTGQRRKVGESGRKIAGKLCLNILLEDSSLEQTNKDIYLAHEVLQMKVLWQREGIYQKYLEDNSWAFRFLPNWTSQYRVSGIEYKGKRKNTHYTVYTILYTITDLLEKLSKKFQLNIMEKPKGMERIEDGALYFHPNDIRSEILTKFKSSVSIL